MNTAENKKDLILNGEYILYDNMRGLFVKTKVEEITEKTILFHDLDSNMFARFDKEWFYSRWEVVEDLNNHISFKEGDVIEWDGVTYHINNITCVVGEKIIHGESVDKSISFTFTQEFLDKKMGNIKLKERIYGEF